MAQRAATRAIFSVKAEDVFGLSTRSRLAADAIVVRAACTFSAPPLGGPHYEAIGERLHHEDNETATASKINDGLAQLTQKAMMRTAC